KVHGGFIDAEGSFHVAGKALEEAQGILLNQQESSVIGRVRFVSIVDEPLLGRGLIAATRRQLNRDEWTRFERLLTNGLEAQIRGLETLNRATLELRQIHERKSKRK